MKPKHIAQLNPNGEPEIIPGKPLSTAVEHPKRVTLDQLDENHHPMLKRAIAAARRWASLKIGGMANVSLVLVAGPLHDKNGAPDLARTGYGCGKTHIARAIQWASYQRLDDGTPVAPAGRFYTAQHLMELLSDGNHMADLAPAGVDTVHGRVGGTPVLVIDDVGAEGVIRYVAKELQDYQKTSRYFQIINYCYERRISLVITANLRIGALAEHIGGRAWSRLLEMAPPGLIVDMTGVPDYRIKKGGRS